MKLLTISMIVLGLFANQAQANSLDYHTINKIDFICTNIAIASNTILNNRKKGYSLKETLKNTDRLLDRQVQLSENISDYNFLDKSLLYKNKKLFQKVTVDLYTKVPVDIISNYKTIDKFTEDLYNVCMIDQLTIVKKGTN